MPQTIVKPSEIHDTLAKIWDSLESTGKMRASLFNLIFYTEDGPRADYTQKIIQNVIEKFPSRVILIRASHTEGVVTKVSVLSPRGPEMDVACDLIDITVSQTECLRVPFLILPHILPDLPVYLLWGKDPSLRDPLFLELKKLATRVIFDSECSESLPEFARSALEHYNSCNADIADLNWARCESWRNVISSVFYSEEKLQDLKNAKKIEIRFNAASTSSFCHTQIQALYLQSWLTVQLEWKPEAVEFKLVPDQQKAFAPASLSALTFLQNLEGTTSLPLPLLLLKRSP